MITKFVRGVDILKLTRQSGENQVQWVQLYCVLRLCVSSVFSILITLLREEGAGLCAYCAFVC